MQNIITSSTYGNLPPGNNIIIEQQTIHDEIVNEPKDFNETNHMTEEIDNNSNNNIVINWTVENENIVTEWCDVAQCYKWMNTKAHTKYSLFNAMFTIPAIILSTVSGTASFSINSLPLNVQIYASIAIGTVNIFIGILTTIQQYLKIAELNESHRVASLSWDKFSRNIRIELSKAPNERIEAGHFIKICRQEYDRLMETSPSIPDYIIREFNTTFSGAPGSSTRRRYEELKKPDICDVIISVNESKNKWYLEKDKYVYQRPFRNINRTFKEYDFNKEKQEKMLEFQEEKMKDKIIQEELKTKQEEKYKNELDAIKNYNMNIQKINDYIQKFDTVNGRKPLTDELIDHLKNKVDNEILSNFLEKYTMEETNNSSFLYESRSFGLHKKSKDSSNESYLAVLFNNNNNNNNV
jgi:hypothetical protein